MRVAGGLRLAATLLVAVSGTAMAQNAIPDGDWRTINRDAASTRCSPLGDISRASVSQPQGSVELSAQDLRHRGSRW